MATHTRRLFVLTLTLLFAVAGVTAPDAHAQEEGAGLIDPRVFRDSLSRITERRTIRAIEQQHARSNTAAGSTAAGLAALRSYELSRLGTDARNARRHFEKASRLDPNAAWPLYGWAVAVLPMLKPAEDPGRFGFAGDNALMDDLGLDPRSRARRALEKAVKLDPAMADAAQLLAKLAVDTRDEDAASQATTSLRGIAEREPGDARSRIALANAELAAGDLEAAAQAAKAAVAVATGPLLSTARHVAARALLQMDGREQEGAAYYFAGLQDLTRDEAALYYEELRGIATRSEMAQLETLPFVRAHSWIETFWDMHAAMSAVSVPHRLATHFSRLPHANAYYRRNQRFGAPTRNALLLDRPESPLDDRGVIYVRHGRPDDVVRTRNTESWVYTNLGGRPEMYHFTDGASEGIKGFSDWYLMYNLPCDQDFHVARAVYDKRLSKLIHHCDAMSNREVSALVRRDVKQALDNDADDIGFTRSLPATYDIYTFRGRSGWTDIVATVGIQAATLQPSSGPGNTKVYAVNTSVIVIDTSSRAVARKDTVVQAQAAQVASRGSIVLGDVALSALPGEGTIHRVVVADANDETHGQLYGGPLKVPSYAADTLMLSDVVLAAPNTGGSFNRGVVSLSLVPWQAFERGEFRIFYELYNVSPGHPYTTEIRLESVGRGVGGAVAGLLGKRPAVSLRFDDVAPATGLVIQQVRDAQADPSPGEYKLTVTITDQRTGQKVSRERPVTVVR
jgi:GWxTD domain-containing protein